MKNSLQYLPECINSIIRQNYSDYEIIISDDSSGDGTKEYLSTIHHDKIKIIHTLRPLNVSEHFEFAIQNASGEWLMTLGADDGLQPYFFTLADRLTFYATKKKIRAIASKRAYYFWDGCQSVYGDIAVQYSTDFSNLYKIKKSSTEIKKTLLSFNKIHANYHSLPTMYTTSLFHSSLIKDAKQKQNGKIFTFTFPDANLAALSSTIEYYYMESAIPLGWVGTSPKTINRSEELNNYLNKQLPLCCGCYNLGEAAIYFWGALITLPYDFSIKKLIKSKFFKTLMFSKVLSKIQILKKNERVLKMQMFDELIRINKISFKWVSFLCSLGSIFNGISRYPLKLRKKISRKLLRLIYTVYRDISHSISLGITRGEHPQISLTEASDMVMELIQTSSVFNDRINS